MHHAPHRLCVRYISLSIMLSRGLHGLFLHVFVLCLVYLGSVASFSVWVLLASFHFLARWPLFSFGFCCPFFCLGSFWPLCLSLYSLFACGSLSLSVSRRLWSLSFSRVTPLSLLGSLASSAYGCFWALWPLQLWVLLPFVFGLIGFCCPFCLCRFWALWPLQLQVASGLFGLFSWWSLLGSLASSAMGFLCPWELCHCLSLSVLSALSDALSTLTALSALSGVSQISSHSLQASLISFWRRLKRWGGRLGRLW